MTVFANLALATLILAVHSKANLLSPPSNLNGLVGVACSSGCVIESVCYNDPSAKMKELELCNCKLLEDLKKCVKGPNQVSAQSVPDVVDVPEDQKAANAENVDDGSQDTDVPIDDPSRDPQQAAAAADDDSNCSDESKGTSSQSVDDGSQDVNSPEEFPTQDPQPVDAASADDPDCPDESNDTNAESVDDDSQNTAAPIDNIPAQGAPQAASSFGGPIGTNAESVDDGSEDMEAPLAGQSPAQNTPYDAASADDADCPEDQKAANAESVDDGSESTDAPIVADNVSADTGSPSTTIPDALAIESKNDDCPCQLAGTRSTERRYPGGDLSVFFDKLGNLLPGYSLPAKYQDKD